MLKAVPLLALALLAACEDGQPERNVTSVRASNTESDQLKTMPPLYRHLGLWRAIRDSGQYCKRVDAGAYQQDYRNMAVWTAHCTDTGQWAVFIAPNSDVQVRRCADTEALKLPACKPLAPEPPDPALGPAKAG